LGKVIDDQARRGGLSQNQLAILSGVPAPTLNQIINGKAAIDMEQLAKVADTLGVRASDLMELAEGKAAGGTSSEKQTG